MSRYIDANRLKETLRQGAFSSVMKVIDREPTADVQEVKYGKWEAVTEPKDNVYGAVKYKCTYCGDEVMLNPEWLDLEHYCRNCGAKMDEVIEDEID